MTRRALSLFTDNFYKQDLSLIDCLEISCSVRSVFSQELLRVRLEFLLSIYDISFVFLTSDEG